VSDGGFKDGGDDRFWNVFLMPTLGLARATEKDADNGAVDEDAAIEVDEVVEMTTDDLDDIDALPLTYPMQVPIQCSLHCLT